MYKNVWLTKLENEALFRKGTLRTFYSLKQIFQKEVYLDILDNRSHQQALTQLRISAHKLEIENGRYSKKPIDDRTCKKYFQNQKTKCNLFVIARFIILKELNFSIA